MMSEVAVENVVAQIEVVVQPVEVEVIVEPVEVEVTAEPTAVEVIAEPVEVEVAYESVTVEVTSGGQVGPAGPRDVEVDGQPAVLKFVSLGDGTHKMVLSDG